MPRTIGIQAHSIVACDSVVARTVQYGNPHQAELTILVALANRIKWRQICFVAGVGGRNDVCGFHNAA